jgi:hypothetical protein
MVVPHLVTAAVQDIVRLRRTLGAPILDWRPHGLTSPHRLLCTGASLAGTCSTCATRGYNAGILELIVDSSAGVHVTHTLP